MRDKRIEKFITKQKEEAMPIVIDIRRTLRYREGILEGESRGISKGISKGMEIATKERNTAIVKNLLLNTNHTIKEIAGFVNVL